MRDPQLLMFGTTSIQILKSVTDERDDHATWRHQTLKRVFFFCVIKVNPRSILRPEERSCRVRVKVSENKNNRKSVEKPSNVLIRETYMEKKGQIKSCLSSTLKGSSWSAELGKYHCASALASLFSYYSRCGSHTPVCLILRLNTALKALHVTRGLLLSFPPSSLLRRPIIWIALKPQRCDYLKASPKALHSHTGLHTFEKHNNLLINKQKCCWLRIWWHISCIVTTSLLTYCTVHQKPHLKH